ncbi:MAG: MCP four helix bundle domain-containing protein [Cyclobacteriaceae bacterium]|nr:MCP four helix bundle domain-containing protein [Cyclobacteriaceae bacterium SS2]
MKWKDILKHKNNTGIVMIVVLGLLILLVFSHRRNLSDLQDSFSSIYSDRLVATDHIYELSQLISNKKMLIDRSDDDITRRVIHIDDTIQQMLTKYEKTYLTDEESALLSGLKDRIRISQQYEQQLIKLSPSDQSVELKVELAHQYDLILLGLKQLSKLQLNEGQLLAEESKRIVASDTIAFRLEIGLFLILGLLVFVIFSAAPAHRVIEPPRIN